MRERAEQIVSGALIMQHIIQPGATVIGVEDNKPESIAAIEAAIADTGLELATFPTNCLLYTSDAADDRTWG